jgi:hypothetical protein
MNDRQRSGALVLSILLIAAGGFSVLSAANGGLEDADSSIDAEASVCEPFSAPIELSTAGLTLSIGPPMDRDGDRLCEDLNGDGESTLLDAVLHALVVTAIDAGELDPTAEQTNALDADRDGEAGYDDAFALARSTLPTDDGSGGTSVEAWVEYVRTTISGDRP